MGAAVATAAGPSSPRRTGPTPSRARRIRTAIRLSAVTVLGGGALLGLGTFLYFNRGDPEGSAKFANREIDNLLQRGEIVEHRVRVQRRRWFDYFRITHGVLAATNRRLLYVGVPPEDVIPHEREPLELDDAVFTFDRPITTRPVRVFPSDLVGIDIASGGRHVTLGVTPLNRPKLDSTLAVVTARQDELRAAAAAEEKAIEAATAASRRAIYHLVQPGEALELIAERYGISVDSLRVWNKLTTDRIAAGKRVLVRPAQ
ncbi:MAG: LysM domain-containing protein [Gemmatimonadaceae bacterium]